VEALENQDCLDAVAELALGLPTGWQLALASRRRPRLPVALLRAKGQVVEVGTADLAMDDREGQALLEGAGVGLSDPEVVELIDRTEGWPVGLYLAALARQAGPPSSAGFAFTGDDRFMADYLGSELLVQLPAELVQFLTPHGGAGAHVRAAVRRRPRHQGIGPGPGVVGGLEPARCAAGPSP
jgi:LuxR family transcriptional regulator, maltose regulon positive regulatory protein